MNCISKARCRASFNWKVQNDTSTLVLYLAARLKNSHPGRGSDHLGSGMTGFNLSDLAHHIPPPLFFTYFTSGPVTSRRREVRPSCWGYSKHHRYHYTVEQSSSCSSNDLGPRLGLLEPIHFSNDSNDSWSFLVIQRCYCRVWVSTETKNRFFCSCHISMWPVLLFDQAQQKRPCLPLDYQWRSGQPIAIWFSVDILFNLDWA